jgi:Flp pilus assembly protein TadD
MTHNNMGVAQLNLGRIAEADQHFRMASEIDSEAPLPYYNLALLAQMRGDTESANSLLNKSQELGYSGTTL